MNATSDETMLIRCEKDGVPFVFVTDSERGSLIVCPVCGDGWQYEKITENSARLEEGILSEEQLISLKRQIGAPRKQR